jgi:crotonobetainyl-CoA:carnitine CoA-transferase CaiB-like acyl-CoA transferase
MLWWRTSVPELLTNGGYGQSGPYASKASYDRIALAFAGYTYITGYPDLPPLRPGIAIADYVGGLYGAFSILLALQHRNNTGKGLHVDVALYEALYRLTEVLTVSYDKLGQERTRMGNLHFAAAPGGHFKTRDGDYVVLTVSGGDGVFRRFAEAIGRPELTSDPRFDTHQHRWENIGETNKLVEDWMSGLSTQEVLDTLDKYGIPASKVYSIKDMLADPQYQARESYQTIEHPRLGPLRMQAPTPKLSEAEGRITHPGPQLGENNDEVFQGLLGLSREEAEQLREDGVI